MSMPGRARTDRPAVLHHKYRQIKNIALAKTNSESVFGFGRVGYLPFAAIGPTPEDYMPTRPYNSYLPGLSARQRKTVLHNDSCLAQLCTCSITLHRLAHVLSDESSIIILIISVVFVLIGTPNSADNQCEQAVMQQGTPTL